MFSIYTVKRLAALSLPPFYTTIAFYIAVSNYGLLTGLGVALVCMLVSIFSGSLLLRNEYSAMMEGAGIITFVLDSSGIIRPFIMTVLKPFCWGRHNGKDIKTPYNRETFFNLAAPIKGGTIQQVQDTDGKVHINIKLTEEEYNKSRFLSNHRPALIYNEVMGLTITKDWLSKKETGLMAEHIGLFLVKETERIASSVQGFARYVIIKSNEKMGSWVWIIGLIVIIGLIGLLIFMVGPKLLPLLGKGITLGTSATKDAIVTRG